jgi:hypothetical protein
MGIEIIDLREILLLKLEGFLTILQGGPAISKEARGIP